VRLLVADSEGPDARDTRRASVGQSAGESFAALLTDLEPTARIVLATPADADAPVLSTEQLAAFDGVFLTGSPLHVYDDTPEVRRELAFMHTVFRSQTPAFGSCAGLQVAVAAAGGTVRPMGERREAGVARGIWATEGGRDHPLLRGRPPAWCALTMHGDEIDQLPAAATLLAGNGAAAVQAVEIRHEGGIFWGVQYHPELTLHEIGAALRRDLDTLVEAGLARDTAAVTRQAELLESLDREPDRIDLAWQLGVDRQITDATLRRCEIFNFLNELVRPRAGSHSATREA
jgi:GMP synthase (glutamine-hydrolysing)